jgi:uncharacterized protein YkwD
MHLTRFLFLSLIISFFPMSLEATSTKASAQQVILKEINRYRASRWLKPLTLDPKLSAIAEKHSADMIHQGFGHQGFNRRYQQMMTIYKNANGGAENIAMSPQRVIDVAKGWIQSSGHRQNIVGSYQLTGIGIAYGKNRQVYYTQVFLRVRA